MTAPNIILIVFDDIAFEQLQRMPQLAKLGLKGVSFLKAACSTPLCQPARMTFLTGQYSHNHGVVDNSLTGFPIDHTTTLPARLQAAGYKTSFVGKYLNSWLIGNPIPPCWNDWHHTSPVTYNNVTINDNGVTTSPTPSYHTTLVQTRALAYMAGAPQPFFMQVSFKAPHPENTGYPNISPDAGYSGVSPGSRLAPRNANFNVPMGSPPAFMAHAAMNGTDINTMDAFWRAQNEVLLSADRAIQAIVAAAPANTIFIVTADHGYMHGEGRDPSEKTIPYWPDLQIPLIISGPAGLVAQNKVCSELVTQVDIVATIYALVGATSVRTLDGKSLLPLLADPNSGPVRTSMLLEFLAGDATGTGWGVVTPVWRSVLSPFFLYTAYATAEQELFDLVADPFQLTNLAGVAAYAGKRANMAAQIAATQACVGAACVI